MDPIAEEHNQRLEGIRIFISPRLLHIEIGKRVAAEIVKVSHMNESRDAKEKEYHEAIEDFTADWFFRIQEYGNERNGQERKHLNPRDGS